MLLTISYNGNNTQDLGYLLHKNPERAQEFELSYGKAYVFYPEVSDERTTVALLLDIDPLDLARGKEGSGGGGLFDFVNDRPYASTSFMSTAIARVFGTALSGKCEKRPELVKEMLNLTATIYSLKDNGNEELASELFGPLGYEVSVKRTILDDAFPEWGDSPYIDLSIRGVVRLTDLLNHLYVLIPVFDRRKHYYITKDEVQKLLDHGKGWLTDHPCKEKIAKRYFPHINRFARTALQSLLSDENWEQDEISELEQKDPEEEEDRIPLNRQRMEAVRDAVLASGATTVLDLGCGEGRLTSLLLNEQQIRKVTACDVSVATLEKVAKKLHMDEMNIHRREKLQLIQGSLTYRDRRFEGYDCACVIEVIEHIDPMRLPAFERVLFEYAKPHTVILTTPNIEYNVNYASLKEGMFRHGDHRFEWTRDEFKTWTDQICEKYGYTCEISGIGDADEEHGAPTQMGVFRRDG